jgi:hypothetical protein
MPAKNAKTAPAHRFARTFIIGPGQFDRSAYDTTADELSVATSATQAGYRLPEGAKVTLDSVTERVDGVELVYSVATGEPEPDESPDKTDSTEPEPDE